MGRFCPSWLGRFRSGRGFARTARRNNLHVVLPEEAGSVLSDQVPLGLREPLDRPVNPFWACQADRKVGGVGRQAVDALLRRGAFFVSVAGLTTVFAVSFAVTSVLGVVVPAVLALLP